MVSITRRNSMTRNVAFSLALCATALLMPAVSGYAQEKDGLSKTDRLLFQAQKICPVMGKDLTKMGGPIKAKVGEQTIFLCCKGCLDKQISKEHWAQIQANLKAAQGLCPVRNVALGSEAVPVVVKGRAVYVCCNAGYCIKQVQAHPDKYLAIVDGLLEKNSLGNAGVGQQR